MREPILKLISKTLKFMAAKMMNDETTKAVILDRTVFLVSSFLILFVTYYIELPDWPKPIPRMVVELVVEKTPQGEGDPPLIAAWLEKDDKFVCTLNMFSADRMRLGYLNYWKAKSRKTESYRDIDAVTAATLKWGENRLLRYKLMRDNYDLRQGGYKFCVESRCDDDKPPFVVKVDIDKSKPKKIVKADKGTIREIRLFLKED